MDESSLLDLLECSVCLERLDTTAKVLPCQHTFCRRCLENIVSSRNELRCPECRILVGCEVDDLPANILLVRLLDGIKQRPRNGGSTRQSLVGGGRSLGCAAGISASPPGSGIRDLPVATRSPPVKSLPNLTLTLPCGKALYSYEGKEPGDLPFAKGDIIILRRKVDDNWYHGELNSCHGFLPASYIALLRPLSQTPPTGKALYDFEVKDKDQDKDCLAFLKDEVLTVIRRVDDNWAEGMLGDKIGIFPILYVELNETAKQLMEIDKPTSNPIPGPSFDPSPGLPLGPCSPGPSPDPSSAGSGNGALQRQEEERRGGEGKKNAKKRHSFTAMSVTQRTAQLNNRHSMEISHPVLISSSDPRAAARIQDSPPGPAPSSVGVLVPPRMASVTSELLAQTKVQLPLNIYLALYAYKSQKADELELRKGEMYRVTEKCQDGWFKGTSLRTAASGVFPGNYVTPVSRAPFAVGGSQSSCLSGQEVGGVGQGSKAASPSSAGPSSSRPSPPPSSPQSAAAQLKNCLRFGQQTVNQTRSAMQLVHSPPSSSPERPTTTVSPLRPQRSSPSRSAGQSARPIAALLNGESTNPFQPSSPGPSHSNAPKPEKKEKKGGLLKLLSGAAAKKKASHSPPSSPPTLPLSGAVLPHHTRSGSCPMDAQGRAGSCPIESEMAGAMGLELLNRKSGSLDLNFPRSPPMTRPGIALLALRPEPKPLSRERYRVVVPYPPQSEAEIELRQGDVVFVHKKREDGWYKGTLQRTGRTGLFPGSFVEIF
ncbi:E3 ubiquitin-protein ligase SH3RF3-like [Salvelinus namaycush]|uniref:RING-type E3 ubiquitin transferase n=1 Tax=Salvelinus namaycush TaxID=8040 RepID=A0A8U1H633_SALNM|nr:E3 ubiquitin-protein ligase SH3RF3-like [Salvelinus namaycush]